MVLRLNCLFFLLFFSLFVAFVGLGFFFLFKFWVSQLIKLECGPVLFSHILNIVKTSEIVDEVEHLLIIRIVVEGDDWNTVVDLECERVY